MALERFKQRFSIDTSSLCTLPLHSLLANCYVSSSSICSINLSLIDVIKVNKISVYEGARLQILQIKAYGSRNASGGLYGGGLYGTGWTLEFDHDDLSISKTGPNQTNQWTKLQTRVMFFSEDFPEGVTATFNLFKSGKLQVQGKFHNHDLEDLRRLCIRICGAFVNSIYKELMILKPNCEVKFDVKVALFVMAGDLGICINEWSVEPLLLTCIKEVVHPMNCFLRKDGKKNKLTLNVSFAQESLLDVNMLTWKSGKLHISFSRVHTSIAGVAEIATFIAGVVQMAVFEACRRRLVTQVAKPSKPLRVYNSQFKFLTYKGKTFKDFSAKELSDEVIRLNVEMPLPPEGNKWITGAKKKFMFFALRSLLEQKHFVPFDDSEIFSVCRKLKAKS